MKVTLTVNGVQQALDVDTRSSLLDTIREKLALTGSKKGCDQGQCGACTVLLDGRRVVSCLQLTVAVDGREVTTIEGIAEGEELHPVQQAFIDLDGYQCGYCTPGQICSAVAVLKEYADGWPSAATDGESPLALDMTEIRERMSGNLCRCGAYGGIVAAVLRAGVA